MTRLEHDVQTLAQCTDGTSISKGNERKILFRTRNQKTAVKFSLDPKIYALPIKLMTHFL